MVRIGRFEPLYSLGKGSFGEVFLAHHHDWKYEAAVKVLNHVDAHRTQRFEREFETIRFLSHRNLLQLFNFHRQDLPHISMEFVDGSPIDAYANSLEPDSIRRYERWRNVAHQLLAAMYYLHAAQRVHLDLHPRNILVTREGELKVLDFGLARTQYDLDLESGKQSSFSAGRFAAPELRSADGHLTKTADLYSIAAILYQCAGDPWVEQYALRRADKPGGWRMLPQLREYLPEVAPETARLLFASLNPRPDDRPSIEELLAEFKIDTSKAMGPLLPTPPDISRSLIGRDIELNRLAKVFDDRYGNSVTITLIEARSGMGKSALLGAFSHHVMNCDPRPLIIRGRFYEPGGGSSQFSHILVNGLQLYFEDPETSGQQQKSLRGHCREDPVLLRYFPEAGSVKQPELEVESDPLNARYRAASALAGLLKAIAATTPVVFCLDDLQWADTDSAEWLTLLLTMPDIPAVTLVGTYRSDENDSSPFLRQFPESVLNHSNIRVETIELKPLSLESSLQLVKERLGRRLYISPEFVETLAKNAEGMPFILVEVSEYHQHRLTLDGRPEPSSQIESFLKDRFWELDHTERDLMTVLSLAGHPLRLDVLLSTAGVSTRHMSTLIRLNNGRFLRHNATDGYFEPYHDKIRSMVVQELEHHAPEQIPLLHARLAQTIREHDESDVVYIAFHYREAGDRKNGRQYSEKAADKLRAELFFSAAAEQARHALELTDEHDREEQLRLSVRVADLRLDAGHMVEAAEYYGRAVPFADSIFRLELKRRAAYLTFTSGQFVKGEEAAEALLMEVGIKPPKNLGLFFRVEVFLHMLLRIFIPQWGLNRTITRGNTNTLMASDILFCMAIMYGLVKPPYFVYYQLRHSRLAARYGDAERKVRAWRMEMIFWSLLFRSPKNRQTILAQKLVASDSYRDDPLFRGQVELNLGMCAAHQGEWTQARRHIEVAGIAIPAGLRRYTRPQANVQVNGSELFDILAQRSIHYISCRHDLHVIHLYRLVVGAQQGDLNYYRQHLVTAIRVLQSSSDVNLQAHVMSYSFLHHAMNDTTSEWYRDFHPLVRQFSNTPENFHIFFGYLSAIRLCIYENEFAQATALLRTHILSPEGRKILQTGADIAESALQSRSIVLLWEWTLNRPFGAGILTMHKQMRRIIASLKQGNTSFRHALGRLIDAIYRTYYDGPSGIVEEMAKIEGKFRRLDMPVMYQITRLRRGEVLGGSEGQDLAEECITWLRANGVVKPEKFQRMYAPAIHPSANKLLNS